MNSQILDDVAISLETQGDTGSASRVKITISQQGNQRQTLTRARVRVCNEDAYANATNATIAVVAGKGLLLASNTSTKDIDVSSEDGAQATGTLTISGVVVEGETFTVRSTAYKFDAGGLSAADLVGFTAVDISGDATASQGTLTVDTQPTALDSMRIGSKTYTFVATGTAAADGEIALGANVAATKPNIVAAINGTDGVNTAHPLVTAAAFASDDCVITAISGGTAGDAIATIESFTAGTNVFDAATLGTTTAGVDCVAADAVTAIVADFSDTQIVATDGAGDTVVFTATAGTAANSYATTETMANGAFGAATMSGGLDALPGEIWIDVTDATAETVTLRVGAPAFGGQAAHYNEASLNITHPSA